MVILWILGLLAAIPWLLTIAYIGSASVYGLVDEMIHKDKVTFSSPEWKEGNKKTRFAYVDALLASKLIEDKSPEEVRELLGEPDTIEETAWSYETKRPGWRLIDFSGGGVAVHFDAQGRVKEVKDTRWID